MKDQQRCSMVRVMILAPGAHEREATKIKKFNISKPGYSRKISRLPCR